jgi:5-methylcytosine-specific restriction endonuclease McrA
LKGRTHAPRQRFCGTACWYTYLRAHPEQNPGWRDGIRKRVYGPNWGEQKRLARERDQYTCQRCGVWQVRPRLHVHHLQPRRMFGSDYEAANALENLVSLCRPCHLLTEWETERAWALARTVGVQATVAAPDA